MNTRQLRRQQIITRIKATVEEATNQGTALNYEKLISNVSLDTGVARRTVMEYLDTLIGAEIIFRKGDFLYSDASKVVKELERLVKKDPYDLRTYTSEELKDFFKESEKERKTFDIDKMKEDGNKTN